MTTTNVATLVLIAVAAVLAPILSELTGRLEIPEIVIQIGFGILLGPYVFDLAHVDNVVTGLSDLGLTYLIFLAGYELDLERIRGKPLRLATAGYGISLLIGLGAAFGCPVGLAAGWLVGVAAAGEVVGAHAGVCPGVGVAR